MREGTYRGRPVLIIGTDRTREGAWHTIQFPVFVTPKGEPIWGSDGLKKWVPTSEVEES